MARPRLLLLPPAPELLLLLTSCVEEDVEEAFPPPPLLLDRLVGEGRFKKGDNSFAAMCSLSRCSGEVIVPGGVDEREVVDDEMPPSPPAIDVGGIMG